MSGKENWDKMRESVVTDDALREHVRLVADRSFLSFDEDCYLCVEAVRRGIKVRT